MMFVADIVVSSTRFHIPGSSAFELLGNHYMLGGQTEDVIVNVGDQIREIKGYIKDIKTDITGLMRLEVELEVHNTPRVEQVDVGCGKTK